MVSERNPIVAVLPPQMGQNQQQSQQTGRIKLRTLKYLDLRQHRKQDNQCPVIFAVCQCGDRHPHPQGIAPPAPLRKTFEKEQIQCGKEHQRAVRDRNKPVQLQDGHRRCDQCKQIRIPYGRAFRADDPPQHPQIDRLQNRKKETNAQFSPQEVPEPYQQRRHRRMVEIAPSQILGEHIVIGLVVGEFGTSGLNHIDDPPYPEPHPDPCLRISDSN